MCSHEQMKWLLFGTALGAAAGAACSKAKGGSSAPAGEPAKLFKWKSGELGRSPRERRGLFRKFVRDLQDDITKTLGELDGEKTFFEDAWVKEMGNGEGRTRVLKDGKVFENAGCNWSEVYGSNLPPSILARYPHLKGKRFYATGVSMVLHPRNPHCPTVHLNYRFFEAGDLDSDEMEEKNVWWFGGGMDLTPWVLYEDDAKEFHQFVKDACDKHNPIFYPALKKYADEYFYNKHRKEGRGIGGHFFDYLSGNPSELLYQGDKKDYKELFAAKGWYQPEMSWTDLFEFAKSQGAAFLPAYTAIIKRRMNTKFTESERRWQEYRRGRYVEFNLVHDRGTLFGLQIGGRTESILMSLPAIVRWGYMVKAETEKEKALVDALENPKDWLGVEKSA